MEDLLLAEGEQSEQFGLPFYFIGLECALTRLSHPINFQINVNIGLTISGLSIGGPQNHN